MRLLLAAAVSLAATTAIAPASAQTSPEKGFSFRSGSGSGFASERRGDRRRDRGDSFIYVDRDYQGDTAFRADSFNDWWHERPNRSVPRWVRHNQDCQRMYWSGGGWRC